MFSLVSTWMGGQKQEDNMIVPSQMLDLSIPLPELVLSLVYRTYRTTEHFSGFADLKITAELSTGLMPTYRVTVLPYVFTSCCTGTYMHHCTATVLVVIFQLLFLRVVVVILLYTLLVNFQYIRLPSSLAFQT